MQHVLILTKNALAEEKLISKIQRMNCEILCSADLFYRLHQGKPSPFLSYFHWIILSESLCNSEVEQILNLLENHPLLVLRVVETFPIEEEQSYWRKLGLTDWISPEASYETLREKMNELQKQLKLESSEGRQVLFFPSGESDHSSSSLKMLITSLSKTEKRLFERLIQEQQKNGALSRQELCEYLWNEGSTPSNLSQLSCLINKLKHKFELNGYKGESILTMWGRGYKLSNEFYEFWLEGAQQLENLEYGTI